MSDLQKIYKFSQINFSFTQYQIISKCSACLKATMDHKCTYAKQMISKRDSFALSIVLCEFYKANAPTHISKITFRMR